MISTTVLPRNGRKDARLIHLGEVNESRGTRGRRTFEAGSKGSDNWGTRGADDRIAREGWPKWGTRSNRRCKLSAIIPSTSLVGPSSRL